MDDSGDLQLNISTKQVPAKPPNSKNRRKNKSNEDFSINVVKKPQLQGKTFAKKRPFSKDSEESLEKSKFSLLNTDNGDEPSNETHKSRPKRDFRESSVKKFEWHNRRQQGDDSDERGEPREPTMSSKIKSLFYYNPEVPVVGQRHVRPIDEKVFSGKEFTDLHVHPHQLANLEKNLGLKQLTVVQQKATPIILQGRDVLVRSQTGSGKTLAYGLPIVEALQALRPKLKRQDGVKALIIVPTRELALQTYELFVKLVYPFQWIVPGYLIGGEKRKAEKNRIKKGINILIGTPGRVCDHIQQTHSLKLNDTRCLILDEADRLFDMGYEKDVASIIESLEKHKAHSGYDPLAIVRENIKRTHLKFDDEDEETVKKEEKPTIKEEKPTKDEEKPTIEETTYTHELTNVFLSERRSTVLLSATLTKAVQSLAGLTMVDPVFIDASEGRALVADSLPKPEEVVKEKIEPEDDNELEIVAQEKSDNEEEKAIKPDPDDTEEDEEKHVPEKKKKKKVKRSQVIQDVFRDFGCKDDDSDSDYDFFAALKSESKSAQPVATEFVTESGNFDNAFQNALQNAIVQDEMVVPSSVNQVYIVTPMKLRLVTLSSIIIDRCVRSGSGKVLIFMATQDMIDYHCELLSRVLTGKKPISFDAKREDTFKKINEKKLKKMKLKKKMKNKNQDEEVEEKEKSEEEEEEQKPPKEEIETVVETVKKEEKNNDYEMSIAEWEEKMRMKNAFVDVDFFQLHGSMDQRTRTHVFKTFRKAKSGVLLCTDVAARGLDLPHVDCIVQYTGPISATDYVHRVGRTARAGNVGTAIMLLLPSEVLFVRQLEERRIRLHQEELENHITALVKKEDARRNSRRDALDPEQKAAVELQAACEELVEKDKDLHMKGCKAFTSWMRFYSTYPREARAAFDRKELHVGHAARSLAIKDTPREIAKIVPAQEPRRKPTDLKRKKEAAQESGQVEVRKPKVSYKTASRERRQIIGEFESGLEPSKKKKKKKLINDDDDE